MSAATAAGWREAARQAYADEQKARDEAVRSATVRIAAAGKAAGKAVCALTGGGEDAAWLKELGVTAMIVASDQGFMRQAAARAHAEFRQLSG